MRIICHQNMRKQNIKSNDNNFALNLWQLFLFIINSVNKDHNDFNQIFVFFTHKQIQIIKDKRRCFKLMGIFFLNIRVRL